MPDRCFKLKAVTVQLVIPSEPFQLISTNFLFSSFLVIILQLHLKAVFLKRVQIRLFPLLKFLTRLSTNDIISMLG